MDTNGEGGAGRGKLNIQCPIINFQGNSQRDRSARKRLNEGTTGTSFHHRGHREHRGERGKLYRINRIYRIEQPGRLPQRAQRGGQGGLLRRRTGRAGKQPRMARRTRMGRGQPKTFTTEAQRTQRGRRRAGCSAGGREEGESHHGWHGGHGWKAGGGRRRGFLLGLGQARNKTLFAMFRKPIVILIPVYRTNMFIRVIGVIRGGLHARDLQFGPLPSRLGKGTIGA